MKLTYFSVLVLFFISFIGFAQKEITIEDVANNKFSPRSVAQIKWLNNGEFYTALKDNKIIKYNITSGEEVDVLYDSTLFTINSYSFSANERQILILTEKHKIYRHSYKGKFYIYNIDTKVLTSLSDQNDQSYATFSPDGTKIAFVRNNNLFYKDLKTQKEYTVTKDGSFNSLINGSTDWVYEEEFAFTKAFFWSPNSNKLAYYVFDESNVKEYNMQLWVNHDSYPHDYKFKYPKAGEDNSKVSIKVYNLNTKEYQTIDLGQDTDIYISSIKWTLDNNILSIRKLNRWQNELTLLHFNVDNFKIDTVIIEKSDTYIDFNYCHTLIYLQDKKHFIFASEKTGYKHFFLYTMEGKIIRQITTGNWEVDVFIGFDKTQQLIYYTSTEVSSLERHFYRIDIEGKKKKLLSKKKGYHRIDMSPDCQYYTDNYSNSTTLPRVSLYRTQRNKLLKVLEDNQALKEELGDYQLSPTKFFSYKTSDNLLLNGQMILPPNFDKQKKYPVLIYVYGGPGSQLVKDSWRSSRDYWHHLLSQKGYIIITVDNRGTDGRGSDFKKSTYLNLGKYEVLDQIDLVKYLHTQKYVIKDRIGVWGWSYGGYMSSLLITLGADFYKLAIAVAPVTHWRFYDSIYTERYLRRPQDNQKGYNDFSPVYHAEKLKGKYLLIHGTGDDNVHFQNAIAMQNALVKANKQFTSFYYPNRNHSMANIPSYLHLYQMMTSFILENL